MILWRSIDILVLAGVTGKLLRQMVAWRVTGKLLRETVAGE